MTRARVLDSNGQVLSPCEADKSERLVADGAAEIISLEPLTIRLLHPVTKTTRRIAAPRKTGGPLLLHVCCGPCATYTTRHLQESGWDVTGFWFNPNIEPGDEYSRRLASMQRLAKVTNLAMVWDTTSTSEEFRQAVAGHEWFGERCQICYRLRLQQTAKAAAQRGISTISTSLLISPYQNLEQLQTIGEEEAQACGIRFYFENMRSGYNERTRLSLTYKLYLQTYCGCSISAQESRERRARKAARIG